MAFKNNLWQAILAVFSLCLVLYSQAQIFDGTQNVIIDERQSTNGASSTYAADLDGDGDMDVLSASRDDNKIAWHENTDGKGTFSAPKIISTTADRASSVFAADVDGDGDMDVLSASQFDSKIAWYENTDGKGTFSPEQIISTAAIRANSVYATDVDGDGDMDVLSASANDNKIAWYENTDGAGTFSAQNIITTAADGALSVNAADLDGDGDMDVLSAFSNKIAWYENTDGRGTFGAQQFITSSFADGAVSVYATDLDGDGDLDVLAAYSQDSEIAWYENTDGKGSFAPRQIIGNASRVRSVYSADIDGDGDMDVLSASFNDHKIAWYENTDGKGTFSRQQVITTLANGANCVYASDVDGDGDLDVLSASANDNKIAWYENTDGKGIFSMQKVISKAAEGAKKVYATDLDGDGDMDVLSASFDDDKIAWYENTDGRGTFGAQQVINAAANGALSVYAADLDGDGDMDVLSASLDDDKIAWHENTDGRGTFGAQQVINAAAIGATSVFAADLDGDGDMDVLSASGLDDKIVWYENTDGLGTFSAQQIDSTTVIHAYEVYASDLDGDGDMDVLSASSGGNDIAWYENTDGRGTFGTQQIINTSITRIVYAADLDGDGDMDVLSQNKNADKIAWYENTDGRGTFSTQKIISTVANNTGSVFAADVDGDGDMDVLSASGFFDGKIAWYENTDGKGTFAAEQVISSEVVRARSVFAADLDGDGDMDVLSASEVDNKIAWYENLSPPVGIANNDNKDNTMLWRNTGLGLALKNTVSVKSHVSIYNTQGQLLHATQLSGNSSQHIDLPVGIYLLKVENDGQFSRFKALVY